MGDWKWLDNWLNECDIPVCVAAIGMAAVILLLAFT
jgi:hypothetical protein